ncbi:MAG: hypothetical protein A2161_05820, partial [Candidatus Schekmanbacteria bacterium RBG_13_48_7]
TASKLRENIYRILDNVLETGIPVIIRRRGKILKIVSEEPKSKFDNLEKRNVTEGDPQDYVHMDWYGDWTP